METETKNKLYEGMFLVDSSLAGSDWDGINASIRKILEKAKAEIVSIAKWDDRRLAYDIKGKSRGTYILGYFRVDGGRIQDIEKSVRLSEKIMRVLILSAERFSQEDIEKETPAMKLEKVKQESEEPTQEIPAESLSPVQEVVEVETAEAAEQTEEVEKVEAAEQTEEVEKADATEQTEATKQIPEEETGDSDVSDVSPESGVSMAGESSTENQPEQEQIDGFRPADEKEQPQL